MADADTWMLIGRVVGSFGVHGEMKVEEHTDFPDRFKLLENVSLGRNHVPYRVEASRSHAGRVLLKLAGIDTPEAVRDLVGLDIFIPRSQAMPLPQGAYYLDDVLGSEVKTTEGLTVGEVADVIQTGANDVYVVRSPAGDLLIPVTQDAIRQLDLANRRVVVETWVLDPRL